MIAAMKSPILSCSIVLTLSLAALNAVYADSATWSMDPINSDWNRAANWTPNTVPNGPADVATFSLSDTTGVTLSADSTEVAEIVFDSAATSSFNITVGAGKTFTISGAGVANNSGLTQNLSIGPSLNGEEGLLYFENTATAGTSEVTYTAYGAAAFGSDGSGAVFLGNSSAGSANFVADGATRGLDVGGGFFSFDDNSTAENASFIINGAQNSGGFGGGVGFGGFATAGNATFVINPGTGQNLDAGGMGFDGNASAGNGTFILNAPPPCCLIPAPGISFTDSATGGNGYFMNIGGGVDFSGFTFTGLITTAGNATIINEGGNGRGTFGAATSFGTSTTAGQAFLVATGGENRGGPAHIDIYNDSDGGEAQIEVYGNGYLDVSFRETGMPSVTIGSLDGDGFAYLGPDNLTVGSNNLDTTFAGVIQDDGGIVNGSNGSLTKIGTGMLTLSSENAYTGGTTVEDGKLVVANQSGSGTGTGPVTVTRGKLGGTGIIAGATTIGTGSGRGAFLAPAAGTTVPATLTIQSALTFNADATYTCTFKAQQDRNRNRTKTDQVIANGVTINSGAIVKLIGHITGALTQGTVLSLVSNTSANPISGTFANLPDGSVVTIDGNNLQASYSGGDGNDLTLTVVP